MKKDKMNELLRSYFSGNPDCDLQLLKKELQRPENAELREELLRLKRIKATDFVADEAKMWSRIEMCRTQGKDRRRLSQHLLRYAVVLILPLVLGAVWWLWEKQSGDGKIQTTVVAEIGPGKSQARLLMANGQSMDLPTGEQDTALLQGGAVVLVGVSKTTSYNLLDKGQDSTMLNTISVPRAGEYRLVLSDGTVVWLNSDTELRFPVAFSGGQRKVYLKGEAYFQVVKDRNKPFIVDVNDMHVEVLGTEFNVNTYSLDHKVRTTLVNGCVRVCNSLNDTEVVLEPNQQAVFFQGHTEVKKVDVSTCISWIHGKFYFESVSLEEIAAQLERWYNVDFFFATEELKQDEFTGVVKRDYTVNEILKIIEKTTKLHFEIKGRTVTVRR